MARNVADLVGKKVRKQPPKVAMVWPLPANLMGIELEIDQSQSSAAFLLDTSTMSCWDQHSDGSLRNGREYVLRRPMAGDELAGAIAEIMQYGPFPKNFTGSTHVHMDMIGSEEAPTTHETLRLILLLVFAMENVLYAVGDPGRRYGGFCNPLESATDKLIRTALDPEVSADAFSRTYHKAGSSGDSRYYGMNLLSLGEYGSLEFRYFPTASTSDELIKYVKLVQTFKKAALSLRDVDELVEVFSDQARFVVFIETQFAEFIDLFRDNITFAQASMAIDKARSIAGLPERTRNTPLDLNKIVSSKKWSKLIGKVNKVMNNAMVHVISSNRPLPDPSVGGFMIFSRNVYMSVGDTWAGLHRLFGTSAVLNLTRQQLNALVTIREQAESGDCPLEADSRNALNRILRSYDVSSYDRLNPDATDVQHLEEDESEDWSDDESEEDDE